MKRIFGLLMFSALLAAGCHANGQVPPATTYPVALTWTAPAPTSNWAGCTTSNPCTYAIYRAAQSGASCPDFTLPAWTEITTPTARPSGTSYTDPTAVGAVCYNAETVQTLPGQSKPSNSGPSNNALVTVPVAPTAPPLNGSPTVATALLLAAPPKELAMGAPSTLSARLVRSR